MHSYITMNGAKILKCYYSFDTTN